MKTHVLMTRAIPAKDVRTLLFLVMMRTNVPLMHAIHPAVALTRPSRATMMMNVPLILVHPARDVLTPK
jgi:hypothetical protein